MADPLSIASGVVGILSTVQTLLSDFDNIINAPKTLQSLKTRLKQLDQALASLQSVKDEEWQSLGDSVVAQSRTALESCEKTCNQLRTTLDRWTRRTGKGELKLLDRFLFGYFRQPQVKSINDELSQALAEITALAATANLKSSFQQRDDLKPVILAHQSAMASTVLTDQTNSVEDTVPAWLRNTDVSDETKQLVTYRPSEIIDPADRSTSTRQTMSDAPQSGQFLTPVTRNHFGDGNEGAQVGTHHGHIEAVIPSTRTDRGAPREESPEATPTQAKGDDLNLQFPLPGTTNYFGAGNRGGQIGDHYGRIDLVRGDRGASPEETPDEAPDDRPTTVNAPRRVLKHQAPASRVINNFGRDNEGLQIGTSYGKLVFGRR
ncbi:hypothetical protein VTJ49DRAFT_1449 [Mycothermus thermophilus]|uniref:Azaphilone pigments biosynthesis cluster protein L N-terminal domain-containing protein n=1 Tax=Humicola insolens TaxID=85995 RepID=A0ABR3VCN9_HUMIN